MARAVDRLWQEFVSYCGHRPLCERLLREFIQQHTRALPPDVRGIRASSMLAVLSSRLTLERDGDAA